jgi:hypothetical protein
MSTETQRRILSTHAGSLPRSKRLRELHTQRFRGEPIDDAALAAEVDGAVADVVARQAAAGIDIGNDGEAPRESFFTFVQHRMTGFGGRWARPTMADMTRYPGFFEILNKMYPASGVCGFETSAGFQSVADDICWAKLASLSEGAKIASGRVFGAASNPR